MSDLDLSRETYTIIAARRTQFDQLVWQVPVLVSLRRPFSISIALSHDATRTARVIASVLSLLMTVLSLHLMAKHRQAEVADSHWLEEYESQFKPADASLPWPMHGRTWSDYRNSVDPKIGLFRFFSRFRGFQVWSWGLAMFGVAALVVLLLTAMPTSTITQTRRTPRGAFHGDER